MRIYGVSDKALIMILLGIVLLIVPIFFLYSQNAIDPLGKYEDNDLLREANDAYDKEYYLDAAMYYFAYIHRYPKRMENDEIFGQELLLHFRDSRQRASFAYQMSNSYNYLAAEVGSLRKEISILRMDIAHFGKITSDADRIEEDSSRDRVSSKFKIVSGKLNTVSEKHRQITQQYPDKAEDFNNFLDGELEKIMEKADTALGITPEPLGRPGIPKHIDD